MMLQMKNCLRCLGILILGSVLLPEIAGAQTPTFQFNDYGDVIIGFRKTGNNPHLYELVVDIGSVTNLVALSAGSQITITNFSQARLTDAFADGNGNLQWSAFSAFPFSSAWSTPIGIFPKTTLWFTLASPSVTNQSQPPARSSSSGQGLTRQSIVSVGDPGAFNISTTLGASNVDNTFVLVREPLTAPYAGFNLSSYIGDSSDSTIGDFNTSIVVENMTPNTFTGTVRSDFYQSCPTGFADPVTGATTGNAYFVGYFLFSSNGGMTFTRASAAQHVPPPPPHLTITGAGAGAYNISFASSNSAVYTLYFTNAAGLSSPKSSWPTNAGTIAGDGTTKSFLVTPASSNLFYSVGGQ